MIKFNKNVKKILPYNRKHYMDYLHDDGESEVQWYGFSFQLDNIKEISLAEFVEKYINWFKNIVSKVDNGSYWIVNHDKNDQNWFPNDEDNLTHLRTLFKQNNVPNTFRGALVFTKDELFEFSEDLISYPYAVFDDVNLFYTDLDISYSEFPFIIKILDHLNIDLLSTNKEFLREIVNENSSNLFNIIQYTGTSLL